MSAAVRPYLTAPPETVGFGGWLMEVDGEWVPVPEELPDWDYNTSLKLSTEVSVDTEALRRATGVATGGLALSVSWRSPDGRIAHSALQSDLGDGSPRTLRVELPGERLGPEVDLSTRIVLAEDLSPLGPGIARIAGSVLWEETTRVQLTGSGGRFPAMIVDFAENRLDPDASWTLEIPEDLTTPVQGGLMLLINSRDSALVAAVPGRTAPARALLADMYEQVGVHLLDHAVEHAESLLNEVWERGTLGATLTLLAARYDGGLEALVALRRSKPAAYRAALVGEARRNGAGRCLP